jgi:hypothetical protein
MVVLVDDVELRTYQQSTLAMAQLVPCFQLLPAVSVTVLTVPDPNIAIKMCPLPIDETVTAHDVPEVPEQEVPLVTSC